MIPQVKRWIVTAYFTDEDPRQVIVETINRKFAKWMAGEQITNFYNADKVTISLSKIQLT